MMRWLIRLLAVAFLSTITLTSIWLITYGPRLAFIWHISQSQSAVVHSDWPKAEKEAEEALSTARGMDSDTLLMSMSNLVNILTGQARYKQEAPLIEEWLRTAEQTKGHRSVELVRAHALAGGFYRRQARYEEAAQQYEAAINAAPPPGANDNQALADSFYSLAKLDCYLGKVGEAKLLYQKALANVQPDDALRQRRILAGLGDVDEWHGAYKSAEIKYDRSAQPAPGLAPYERAELVDHLVPLLLSEGKTTQAQKSALEAQELLQRSDGNAYMNTTDTIVNANLSATYLETGDIARAQALTSDVLTQLAKRVSNTHPGYANALVLAARAETRLGRYNQAASLLVQARQLIEKSCGKNHRLIAEVLRRQAELELARGDYKNSEEDFKQAIEVAKCTLPADHPQVAATVKSYANLLRKLGRYAEAEKQSANADQMLQHAMSM